MNRYLHRQRLKWKAAKEKQWEMRVAKSKRRTTSLVFWIPIFVVLVCMIVESVCRLRNGQLMGYNYYFQPLGPAMRLVVSLFLMVVGAVIVWRGRKSRSEDSWKHEQPPRQRDDESAADTTLAI